VGAGVAEQAPTENPKISAMGRSDLLIGAEHSWRASARGR
jgi:hypothetical protein